ncbi:hypothetical protein, partial [Aneurinibacillus migulanus]|uniref:hypothetical protein n=1 Tax=Aneurinibacillus migulanus TaxID=47500 RepID=UPI00209E325B
LKAEAKEDRKTTTVNIKEISNAVTSLNENIIRITEFMKSQTEYSQRQEKRLDEQDGKLDNISNKIYNIENEIAKVNNKKWEAITNFFNSTFGKILGSLILIIVLSWLGYELKDIKPFVP